MSFVARVCSNVANPVVLEPVPPGLREEEERCRTCTKACHVRLVYWRLQSGHWENCIRNVTARRCWIVTPASDTWARSVSRSLSRMECGSVQIQEESISWMLLVPLLLLPLVVSLNAGIFLRQSARSWGDSGSWGA